jgi:hypothetical protein
VLADALRRIGEGDPKTIETHVRSIFLKHDLRESPAGNRRVLAVLRHLRAS